jgi:hypothetical protein
MRKSLLVLLPIAASAIVPSACSSSKPPPPVAPATDLDAAVEAGPWVVADPLEAGAFDAAGAFTYPDAGTTTATNTTGDDATLDTMLAAAAAKSAPKMTAEGQIGRATLAPNEHFNMIVPLTHGRCYTIIGVSPQGQVTQLDLKLLMPPFYTVLSGQSGASDKNTPVIGRGANALCPVIPAAVPYKIDAVATKGAGRIAVQVYARNK